MRWPKYWSFSFSIIPSKEIPGLISFRMDGRHAQSRDFADRAGAGAADDQVGASESELDVLEVLRQMVIALASPRSEEHTSELQSR